MQNVKLAYELPELDTNIHQMCTQIENSTENMGAWKRISHNTVFIERCELLVLSLYLYFLKHGENDHLTALVHEHVTDMALQLVAACQMYVLQNFPNDQDWHGDNSLRANLW